MKHCRLPVQSATRSVDIAVWENEGGAIAPPDMSGQFGRRVEHDRTWTVYHVFSGVPARAGSRTLSGMTRQDATARMQALNTSYDSTWVGPTHVSGMGASQ